MTRFLCSLFVFMFFSLISIGAVLAPAITVMILCFFGVIALSWLIGDIFYETLFK